MEKMGAPMFSRIVVFSRAFKFFVACRLVPANGKRFTVKFMLQCIGIIGGLLLPALIGNYYYLWRVMTQDKVSLSSILECLHANGQIFTAALTGTAALFSGNKLLEFCYYLGIHKFSEPKNLAKVYRKHDKISIFLCYTTLVTLIVKILMNFSNASFCEAKYIFDDERYFCGMMLPFWFPINLNILMRIYVFVSLNLAFLIYMPNAAVGFLLVYGSSELIVLRMKKLQSMLEELDFEGNYRDIEKQLIQCIEYHYEFRSLLKKLNDGLGYTHICQYFLISCVIALLEYELMRSTNLITGTAELIIWLTGEFMVATAGQKIEDEREAIAISLYMTPWYKLPVNLRKTFVIFLAKLQVPLHFEAKPVIHLNYEFLMKVLKGSYSFLMFIQNSSFNEN